MPIIASRAASSARSYGLTSSVGPDITKTGLQLYLDAGNTSSYPGSGTTWYDLSGNERNATIFGTNRFSSENSGKFDFRNISTATDYIRLPHSAAQATSGAYTLMFWMQPVSSGTRYFHSMHNGSNDNHQIMGIASNTIYSYLGGSSIPFSNNEWLQLSLVRNGSDTASMYKNNGSAVSSTLSNIASVTTNGWILNQEQDSVGGTFDSSQNAYAAFSIILLYNRALSQQEILDNFNTFRTRYNI